MNYISAHPDEFKIKDGMTVGQAHVFLCISQIFWNMKENNAKAGAWVAYHPYSVEMDISPILLSYF